MSNLLNCFRNFVEISLLLYSQKKQFITVILEVIENSVKLSKIMKVDSKLNFNILLRKTKLVGIF